MSRDSFIALLIAIGITAGILVGGFLIALSIGKWYHPIPTRIELINPIVAVSRDNTISYAIGNACIGYPYTIKNVSGDNVTGYTLWIQIPSLNIDLEKGKPYSVYVKTEDIEKAIEDYEKDKGE